MVQRCKGCGKKIIKFPLWKGQEDGIPFSLDKVLWLNLFKIDWYTLMWLVVVVTMMVSYEYDTEQCREITNNPLSYCEESNACRIIEERESTNQYGTIDIPNFNLTR